MITPGQIQQTNDWLGQFRSLYNESVPLRIHSREIAGDGSPEWSYEMRRLMTGVERRDQPGELVQPKVRLRRAMKRLRTRSLREYEVMYRVMVMNESLGQVTAWLNERSERGGRSERYTRTDTSVIVYAAVDKLCAYF